MSSLRSDPVVLRQALKRNGITVVKLAALSGISIVYAYAIASGRIPSAAVRDRVAAVLLVPAHVLWPSNDEAPHQILSGNQ